MSSSSGKARNAGCWSRVAFDQLVRRRDVEDGLLRIMRSRWDIRWVEEGAKRVGKEASTPSSIGDSTRGVLSIGLEALRSPCAEGTDDWEVRNLGRGGRYCSLRLLMLLRDVCDGDRSILFARYV